MTSAWRAWLLATGCWVAGCGTWHGPTHIIPGLGGDASTTSPEAGTGALGDAATGDGAAGDSGLITGDASAGLSDAAVGASDAGNGGALDASRAMSDGGI